MMLTYMMDSMGLWLYYLEFTVESHFIFRVTLPVAPEVKTSSEIATLSFLREKTNIPAPKMIAHNQDFEDDLEFKWILMERIPGRPLRKLYHLKLSGIGSLSPDESPSNGDRNTDYIVGEAVIQAFFKDDHIQQPIYRGPFASNQSFVNAHTAFLQHDITKLQHTEHSDSYDSDDEEQTEGMSEIYTKLQKVIPKIFTKPAEEHEHEETILSNGDISLNNIIVSPSGNLVGIVD
ncbi:hypothetical protein J4E91_006366 [Alternaria rosae]|nr:hypothetical protein J4E91_006366 [Alternaria rosae]